MKINEEERALLDIEEQELATVQSSLVKQRRDGERRFLVEKDRSRELTAELVGSRRAEDKHQLASDEALSHKLRDSKKEELEDIEKLVESPYFARVEIEEEINGKLKQISYKLGLRGNTDTRIIDWRKAPISKLYYEYQEGEEYFELIQGRDREGVILKKVKVKIENGTLLEVTNSLGSFFKEGNEWRKGRAPSKGSSTGRMPDVLSLISKEQFQSITEDADSPVLIQGVAGSGKTTVAVHRMAWLLHEENTNYQARDALMLLKSKVLKQYIQNSLEHLNIKGMPVMTWQEWLLKVSKQIDKRFEETTEDSTPYLSYRLKLSAAMLKTIEARDKAFSSGVLKKFSSELEIEKLGTMAKKVLEEQEILEEAIIPFLDRLARAIKVNPDSGSHPLANEIALETISAVKKQAKDYGNEIVESLRDWKSICQFDTSGFMDRKMVEAALKVTQENFLNKQFDDADRALLIVIDRIKRGKSTNHSGLSSAYSHVAIDEVQDFHPIELAAALGSAKTKNDITLSGDISQDLSSKGAFLGWNQLREHWGLEQTSLLELKISYRSTAQIMNLAKYFVSKAKSPSSKTNERIGKPPLWYHCLSEENAFNNMRSWLEKVVEKFPQSLTAVVCASRSEATYIESLLQPSFGPILRFGSDDSFSFDEGIVICQTKTIKGLEFKNVLLWNVSEKNYPDKKQARNILYTAATRAEDNLALISFGRYSPLLPSIDSKLVRGIPEEEEERKERFDPRELR